AVFRSALASLYIQDPATIQIATELLLLCAIYQIPEACLLAINAGLRAYKRTGLILAGSLLAHWLIGFPIGYAVATGRIGPGWVPHGYWVGLIAAFTAASAVLGWTLHWVHAAQKPAASLSLPGVSHAQSA